jgi:hypothetical protein
MSKICPFKVKGVVLWIFFISVQYDFEVSTIIIFYFSLETSFIDFEIVHFKPLKSFKMNEK